MYRSWWQESRISPSQSGSAWLIQFLIRFIFLASSAITVLIHLSLIVKTCLSIGKVPREKHCKSTKRILASFGVGHGVGNGFGHMLTIASVTDVVIGTVTGSVLRSFYLELPLKKSGRVFGSCHILHPPPTNPSTQKEISGVIFFVEFGPCLGIRHPTHPHLGKVPKFTPSLLGALMNWMWLRIS